VYLSTVGYGTGALLGRGVENVEAVHWHEELGIAQAMWVIRANRMGPFIVASDLAGNCLFERENAKIAANLEKLYEGTRPAVPNCVLTIMTATTRRSTGGLPTRPKTTSPAGSPRPTCRSSSSDAAPAWRRQGANVMMVSS
ncbi:MAG: hypothetical protein VW619_11555, partial [Rhodobiaceae bacterium]